MLIKHYNCHFRNKFKKNTFQSIIWISGGKSKEAYFEHLSAQCEPISGTNGGVLIQKQALWESPGEGETIGAICDRFDKTEPDLAEVFFKVILLK